MRRHREGAPWVKKATPPHPLSHLREARPVAGELLIEVKQVERRRRQLAEGGGEDGRVKRGKRRLELRRDERQRLVLDADLNKYIYRRVEGWREGLRIRLIFWCQTSHRPLD